MAQMFVMLLALFAQVERPVSALPTLGRWPPKGRQVGGTLIRRHGERPGCAYAQDGVPAGSPSEDGVDVVLIGGRAEVGQSSVGFEVSELLQAPDVAHVLVDDDNLNAGHPEPPTLTATRWARRTRPHRGSTTPPPAIAG